MQGADFIRRDCTQSVSALEQLEKFFVCLFLCVVLFFRQRRPSTREVCIHLRFYSTRSFQHLNFLHQCPALKLNGFCCLKCHQVTEILCALWLKTPLLSFVFHPSPLLPPFVINESTRNCRRWMELNAILIPESSIMSTRKAKEE